MIETLLMGSVLIIDDSADVTGFISALAKQIDCECVTVADAISGIELLRSRRFDLIILDHHLPGMTGLQMLQRLRVGGLSSNLTPVIFYSGDDNVRREALSLGAVEFILKSGDAGAIAASLAKYAGCNSY